jgi:hypothetical protein
MFLSLFLRRKNSLSHSLLCSLTLVPTCGKAGLPAPTAFFLPRLPLSWLPRSGHQLIHFVVPHKLRQCPQLLLLDPFPLLLLSSHHPGCFSPSLPPDLRI